MDDRIFKEVIRIDVRKWANQCQRSGRKWQKQDKMPVDNPYFSAAKPLKYNVKMQAKVCAGILQLGLLVYVTLAGWPWGSTLLDNKAQRMVTYRR